jgi:predicted DNA-binding protein
VVLQKQFDETPLQVLTDKVTRARIRRLKTHTGRSQAQIVRDILDVGLPMYEEMQGLGGVDDGLGLE